MNLRNESKRLHICRQKGTLFRIKYYYRNSDMTHPPGQCRRKQTDVNFVSRGREPQSCKQTTSKSNRSTTPGPKPNLKGFIDKIPIWAEMCVFQMLQILEELGRQRCKFLI